MNAATKELLCTPFVTRPVKPCSLLRELQLLTGWDDRTTAKKLGVSYHTYRRWRTGRRPNPAALRLLAVYAGHVPWSGWRGWEVHDGLLFPPGSVRGLASSQVAAVPWLLALTQASRRCMDVKSGRTPLVRGGMLNLSSMMQLFRHAVRWRRRTREWGETHPRTIRFLERVGCLRFERGFMARGVAVGLFVALTPTVGFQTVLMLAFCALLRGNFIAAFAVSWISNPLTLTPLYLGYYLLGQLIFEPILHPLSLIAGGDIPEGILDAVCFGLGSLIIALPAAAAGYVLSYWLAHVIALRRLS